MNSTNSYPQMINNLWNTPEIERDSCATLDNSLRFDARREPRTRFSSKPMAKLIGAAIAISAISSPAVASYTPVENYKIYTHLKLASSKEFICVHHLWIKESNWNPKAKNKHSSAFGIPQLLKLKTTNPYRQIDAGLAYIAHRYETPCKAWAFWKHKKKTTGTGWY